mgnify:CR=1 FL=1
MLKILSSLHKTIYASFSITILLFLLLFFLNDGFAFDTLFWSWLFRFIHVVVAIMWIGLFVSSISFVPRLSKNEK